MTTVLLSEAERQQLVLTHYDQVKRIAFGFSRRLPAHVELDDLIGWGLLGLLSAVEQYDPERPFAPLVEVLVKGAIVDALRQQGISRSVLSTQKRLDRCHRSLFQSLGRPPSSSEMADSLGVSEEGFQRLRLRAQVPIEDPDGYEFVMIEQESQEERLLDQQQREQLQQWILQLRTREQIVIRGRMEGKRWSDLATDLGLTEGRISQIYQSGIQQLLRLAGIPAGRRVPLALHP